MKFTQWLQEAEKKHSKLLTPKQTDHLKASIDDFARLTIDKYVAGVKEHGGNLWENPKEWFKEQRKQEIIDNWQYEHAEDYRDTQ